MTDWLLDLVSSIPPVWRTAILAAVPLTELRLSIPLALLWGLSPLAALGWSILGNFIPVLPILWLLGPVVRWLSRFPPAGRVFDFFLTRAAANSHRVATYGFWGLAIFVGVPAPGTGAWTGCLVAFLLGLPVAQAAASITLGLFMAGLIVTAASLGVWQVFRMWAWPALIALATAVVLIYFFRSKSR